MTKAINIHYQSTVPLGRFLERGYLNRYVMPDLGAFSSIMTLWWWLKAREVLPADHADLDLIRTMRPTLLKQWTRAHPKSDAIACAVVTDFWYLITKAYDIRLRSNPVMYHQFCKHTDGFTMEFQASNGAMLSSRTSLQICAALEYLAKTYRNQEALTEHGVENYLKQVGLSSIF